MLRLLVPAAIACGLLLSFPAAAQDGQYVGNSTAILRTGGAGILELNEECVASFGPSARMCTSQEIIQTFNSVSPDPDIPVRETSFVTRQWVSPTIVAGSSSAIDASGLTATGAQLTCNGWANATSTFKGLTIDDNGRFSTQPCNGARQVTCCIPIP